MADCEGCFYKLLKICTNNLDPTFRGPSVIKAFLSRNDDITRTGCEFYITAHLS